MSKVKNNNICPIGLLRTYDTDYKNHDIEFLIDASDNKYVLRVPMSIDMDSLVSLFKNDIVHGMIRLLEVSHLKNSGESIRGKDTQKPTL